MPDAAEETTLIETYAELKANDISLAELREGLVEDRKKLIKAKVDADQTEWVDVYLSALERMEKLEAATNPDQVMSEVMKREETFSNRERGRSVLEFLFELTSKRASLLEFADIEGKGKKISFKASAGSIGNLFFEVILEKLGPEKFGQLILNTGQPDLAKQFADVAEKVRGSWLVPLTPTQNVEVGLLALKHKAERFAAAKPAPNSKREPGAG